MKKLLAIIAALATASVAFGQGAVTRGGVGGLTIQQSGLIAPSFNTTGVTSSTGATIMTANAMAALSIDVTKGVNTKTIAADSTFTFSATPATDTWFSLYLTNSDASPHVITIPSSFSLGSQTTITTFTILGNGQEYLTWRYTGSGYQVLGVPNATTGTGATVLANSPTLITPTLGAALAISVNGVIITNSTGTLTIPNGVVMTGPAASGTVLSTGATIEKLATFSVDGAGSAIATGTISGTARLPYACTITGYAIQATGATGTTTVTFWIKETATSVPTVADIQATVSLTTGTAVTGTAAGFSDAIFAALAMARCAVTVVDGTATDLSVTLYGTRL